MIAESVKDLIGNTPLLRAARFEKAAGVQGALFCKAECFNAGGSSKDRVGLRMLEAAEQAGVLRPGGTVIESTSGNTGVGLAVACALKGYRLIITMPENMSAERRKLLAAYGAELHLTAAEKGMSGAVAEAERLQKEIPGAFLAGQFVNPENVRAHYDTTGPEIWKDLGDKADCFIAGVGTGGTLTGTGRFLKEQNPDIRIVAVEPARSPLLSGGAAGSHGLMGIGADFIPEILDRSLIDEIVPITEEEAYEAARLFVKTEGLLVGITSGAALAAAKKLSEKQEYAGKNMVVLLPDTGERYLSTPLFE